MIVPVKAISDVPGAKADYGVDAPNVLRNLFLFGVPCLLIGLFGPRHLQVGPVTFLLRPMFVGTGMLLVLEGVLFLIYVKYGKLRHRDLMLSLHSWDGGERVLDVGCGRGLLLIGAAKRIVAAGGSGHSTGIDIWSNVDMAANSESSTRRNMELEGVAGCCSLLCADAVVMPFPDASFVVILSNL
jgi:arsenite methyltransferase